MTAATEIRAIRTVPDPASTPTPREPRQLVEPPAPISDRWPYPVRSPRDS